MKSIFEQMGGSYTIQGNYLLPDLILRPEEKRMIGIYGQRYRVYLKQHHKVLYYTLLTSEKLNGYLADIDAQVQELFFQLVNQYAQAECVTEELKADDT